MFFATARIQKFDFLRIWRKNGKAATVFKFYKIRQMRTRVDSLRWGQVCTLQNSTDLGMRPNLYECRILPTDRLSVALENAFDFGARRITKLEIWTIRAKICKRATRSYFIKLDRSEPAFSV